MGISIGIRKEFKPTAYPCECEWCKKPILAGDKREVLFATAWQDNRNIYFCKGHLQKYVDKQLTLWDTTQKVSFATSVIQRNRNAQTEGRKVSRG